MKIIYRDLFGNCYSNKFTLKQAMEMQKTLIDCKNCLDCYECKNCNNCIECEECDNCEACIRCVACVNCFNCKRCYLAKKCNHCEGFSFIEYKKNIKNTINFNIEGRMKYGNCYNR